jgi:hypothetical protein
VSSKIRFGTMSRKAMFMCSVAFIASYIAMTPATAQVLDWDPDPAAGVDGSGSGDWLGVDNWTSDVGATNEAWTDGASASFGFVGPDANGTVTLNGDTTADQVVVSGGALTIGGPGVLTAIPGSSVTVSAGQSLDFQAALSGDWVLSGAGTMFEHSGNSTGLNATISAGTVDNSGTMGGTVVVNAGATLNNTGTLGVVTNDGIVNLEAGGDVTGTFGQSIAGSQTNVSGATTITGLVTMSAGTMSVDAGLTATGGILASGGILDINDVVTGSVEVDGATASLAGSITAGVTVSAGTLTVDGVSVIGGTGTTVDDGTMIVNAALTSNAVVNGGTYDQNADLTGALSNAGGTITLDGNVSTTLTNTAAAGTTIIDGASVVGGAVSVLGGQTIVNAELTATGNVLVDGGALDINNTVNGDVTVDDGSGTLAGEIDGALSVAGGTFTVDGAASSVTGDATVSAGTMTVNQTLTSDILVNGTGIYDQNAALTGSIVNNGGTVTVGGNISGVLTNTTGTTTVDGTTTVTGLTTLSDGELAVTGELTIGAGGFAFDGGTLDIDGTFNGDVENTLNTTTELAGTIDGTFTNTDGNSVVDGVGTVTGLTTVADGELLVTGALTATGNVVVSGGTFDINGTVTGDVENQSGGATELAGTIDGTFTNTDGNSVVDGASDVTGLITVGDGELTVDAALLASGNLDVTGGVLDINDAVTGNVDLTGGAIELAGTVTGVVGLNGPLDTDVLTVDGVSMITGLVTVTQGDMIVNSQLTASGGVVTTANGDLEINSTLIGNVESAGDVAVNGTGSLQGDLNNTGGLATISDAASITGDVQNSGVVNSDGSIGGTYVQNGAFSNFETFGDGATVTGLFTMNDGFATVFAGTTLTLGNGMLVNGGQFDINGIVANATAAVENDGGTVLLDGTVQGAFTNTSGDTTVDGASGIGGVLTVNGGNVIVNETLSVTGDTVVGSGGTLDVNAAMTSDVANAGSTTIDAQLTGGLDNTGTADINATVTGDVTNVGDGVTTGLITLAGSVGGTLFQTSGLTTVDGASTITGLVTVNGGDFVIDQTLGTSNGFQIGSGGTLDINAATTGSVTNAGTTNVDAVLTGGLANTGTADINANVSGDVSNMGDGATTGIITLAGNVGGAFTQTSGLTTMDGAGTITGLLSVNGGDFIVDQALIATSDIIVGALGTLDINAATTGDVTNAGTTTVDAQLTGGIGNTGTADINDTVTGDVTNAGDGTTNGIVTLAGAVGGAFTQVSGLATVDGASTITDLLTVNGGDFVVDQTLIASSDIVVGGNGTLDINAGTTGDVTNAGSTTVDAQLTGGLANTGTADINATVTGNVTNEGNGTTDGVITLAGSVGGTFTQTTGLTTVDGASSITGLVTINDGDFIVDQTLVATGNVEINNGLLDINAQLTGDVTNDSGMVNVDSTLAGNLVNTNGTVDINDTVDGTVDNSGTLTLAGTIDDVFVQTGTGSTTVDGNSNINGDMSVEGTSTFSIEDGFSLMVADNSIAATPFAAFSNQSLTLGAGSSLSTSPANLGSFNLSSGLTTLGDGSAITAGQVTFGGDVVVLGEHTTTASMIQTSSAAFDLSTDAATGGVLNLDGDVDFGGVNLVSLDVELANGAPAGDLVAITGDATGDVVFVFNDITIGAYGPERLSILTAADATGLNQTSQAFASVDNTYVYQVVRDGDVGFALQGDLNPAFLSVLGSINTAQSLVSTVVNRPTSPVTGGSLTVSEDDPCAPGAWGRIVGGIADLTSNTSTQNSSFSSSISAEYGGVQVGFDNSCFASLYDPSASDLVFGFMAGVNTGNTETPVLDPVTSVTSATNTQFTQVYAGGYFVMNRASYTVDLQARYERTEYEFSTSALPSIDGTTVEQDAFTILGAITYAVPLAGLNNVVFVPTAGFSLSQSQATVANFSDGTRMEIDDHLTAVGYVSAAFARIVPLVNPNERFNQFVSLTHYVNASSETTATFIDNIGNRTELESEALPNYSELSVGLNYLRDVTIGERPMTFRAGARIDGRIGGDEFTSTGLTVQFRLQF